MCVFSFSRSSSKGTKSIYVIQMSVINDLCLSSVGARYHDDASINCKEDFNDALIVYKHV